MMDELKLLKFLEDESLETRWFKDELYLWVDLYCIKEFSDLIEDSLSDRGIEVNLQHGYIVLDIIPICEFYGIEPENICSKEDDNGEV